MKKRILFVLILAVLFSACKMKLSENIGTVVIDFGGDERAAGSTGLPDIKDAAMSLEINSSSQGTQKIDFAAGQPKTWSGSFPAGEKLTIKVSLNTASAVWKGSAEHIVTEGTNAISVKLKKSAAALNSLLFGTGKPHASQDPYTLTLNIGSKEIKKENIRYHNFCRDNKGRTYLAYQEGNDYKLERYTSEGKKEDKNFTLPEHCHRLMLASDHKTGKVYLVSEIRGVMTLFRINENGGSPTELTGDPILDPTGYAVYNNVVVASGYASGVQGQVLKMYRINGDNLSEIPLPVQPNLSEDTKIMLGSFSDPHVRINDLYMTENTLYVLFSGYNTRGEYYSLGGIVKYSYTADGTITKVGRIGIKDSHTAQNGIYRTDDNNFYGPVKVIGFDDENLYIADDGVRFEFEKGKPRIKENKNRIATLNRDDDTITFTDAAAGISWQNETPVWPGVNTKALVWKKNSYGGFDYYQLENAGDTLPTETFKPGDGNVSGDNSLTDVFCYDEGGNLYIVKYRSGTYQVCRFELQDDGSYNTSPVIAGQGTSNIINFPGKPTAIAVDISGTVEHGGNPVNVLYYSYNSSGDGYVERLKWSTGFDETEGDVSFNFHPQVSKEITALAANKDGLFAALKESPGIGYTVTVQKYAHTGSAGGTAIQVLDEVINGGTWSRPGDLTALHIQEGILYGLTAVQYRYEYDGTYIYYPKDSISGKLIKIGRSTANFSGNAEVLHTTELPRDKIHDPGSEADTKRKEGGKFAPYRFIAVMPKKLIIASDGFWGHITNRGDPNTDDVKQFHFIWDFGIKDDGSLEGTPQSTETNSVIEFSKTLARRPYCGYEWE